MTDICKERRPILVGCFDGSALPMPLSGHALPIGQHVGLACLCAVDDVRHNDSLPFVTLQHKGVHRTPAPFFS